MKKFLLLTFLLCLSLTAKAVEVGRVVLEDTVHLGNSNLLLNGAGVRSKFVFDLYVAALYLGTKKTTAAAVLNDVGEKRIALHLLRDIGADDFLYTFKKAIEKNHTDAQMQAMKNQLHELDVIFYKTGKVRAGGVITLDYLPALGTQIAVNGVVRGSIEGLEFNAALLKIWLGEKPAQQDLKLKLLGGK